MADLSASPKLETGPNISVKDERREVLGSGLIPWQNLQARRPFYPMAGRGRQGHAAGPRVQLFYNLSDPGMEDLLYEAESVRRFVGLRHSLPDETTIVISWSVTDWGRAYSRRSTPIWTLKDCGCGRGP